MSVRTITAVDLFAGAGGSSTGLAQACEQLGYRLDLTAINHWEIAVATHAANHPNAKHLCASLDSLVPWDAFPRGKRLDLLWASPACTHHSRARGAQPVDDGSRASAWHVLRWLEMLRPTTAIIENVPDFLDWGPTEDGRPIKALRGSTFSAWLAAIQSLGYRAEYAVLNAADYGEATTRRRLFIQAALAELRWPAATHGAFFTRGKLARWAPAASVIDASLPMRVVNGLCARTLERVDEGRAVFGGDPFLVQYYGTSGAASLRKPLPTITTRDRFALVSGSRFRMLQPHELAAAMGFPADYKFAGNKGDAVRQIGNAVSVRTAKALALEALG